MTLTKDQGRKCRIKFVIYSRNIRCWQRSKWNKGLKNWSTDVSRKSIKNRWFIADISNFNYKSLKWEKMAVWAEKVDDTSSIYKGKIDSTTYYVGNWLWQLTNCLFGLWLRFYLAYPIARIMLMYIEVIKWSKWFIKRFRLNLILI